MSNLLTKILAAASFLLGCYTVVQGFEDYNINNELRINGVKAKATLVGYKYIKPARFTQSGDMPIFSYTTSTGIKLTHLAKEYGIASEFNKKDLSKKSVEITYLPKNPSVARINAWVAPYEQYYGFIMGCILCLLSFLLLQKSKMLP
jgi:hypothetical protein